MYHIHIVSERKPPPLVATWRGGCCAWLICCCFYIARGIINLSDFIIASPPNFLLRLVIITMGSDENTFASLSNNYKHTTADKAQVCDGRNWEAVRDTLELERNSADSMDDQDEKSLKKGTDGIANMLRYRPTSSKTLLPNEAEIPIVFSTEKRRDSKSPESFIPRGSFLDSDSETSMLDLSQHSGNVDEAQSEKNSSYSNGERRSRRTSPEDLAFSPNVSKASHSSRRSAGRKGDDATSGRTNRRSSSGDISTSSRTSGQSGNEDISTSSRASRRASIGDDSATSRSKPIFRKLSKPKHRCAETNQSVSGIMRPARYSSNNLADIDSTYDSSGLSTRHSVNNLPAMGRHQSPEMIKATSYSGLPRGGSNASFGANMKIGTSSISNAIWVAHGVQFSNSMEF